MQPRKLFLDTARRTFVDSTDSATVAAVPALFENDVENIQLYFLEPTGTPAQPYAFLDYSALSVALAVGATSSAALLTSFTAISTATAITTSIVVTGGSGTNTIQSVKIGPAPSSGTYALRLPSRNITVSSVSSSIFTAAYHALLDGQSVTLTGFSTPSGFSNGAAYVVRDRGRDTFRIANTVGGTALTVSVASAGGTAVSLTYTTAPLAHSTQPAAVATALAVATGGNADNPDITASGSANDYQLIFGGNFAGANFSAVTASQNTLAAARGLQGNLNLAGITSLVANGTTEAVLEVEVSNGTLKQTYQTPAILSADIIT
jgi:hypothetical protein